MNYKKAVIWCIILGILPIFQTIILVEEHPWYVIGIWWLALIMMCSAYCGIKHCKDLKKVFIKNFIILLLQIVFTVISFPLIDNNRWIWFTVLFFGVGTTAYLLYEKEAKKEENDSQDAYTETAQKTMPPTTDSSDGVNKIKNFISSLNSETINVWDQANLFKILAKLNEYSLVIIVLLENSATDSVLALIPDLPVLGRFSRPIASKLIDALDTQILSKGKGYVMEELVAIWKRQNVSYAILKQGVDNLPSMLADPELKKECINLLKEYYLGEHVERISSESNEDAYDQIMKSTINNISLKSLLNYKNWNPYQFIGFMASLKEYSLVIIVATRTGAKNVIINMMPNIPIVGKLGRNLMANVVEFLYEKTKEIGEGAIMENLVECWKAQGITPIMLVRGVEQLPFTVANDKVKNECIGLVHEYYAE